MDEVTENPRGYAFVSFSRAYEATLAYDWASALRAHADFPPKWEWMRDCLAMFDNISLDNSNFKEVSKQVIKEYRSSLSILANGGFTTVHGDDYGKLQPRYVTLEPHVLNHQPAVAKPNMAISDVDTADETRVRMALLRKKLTPKEYQALDAWVYSDAVDFKEAVMTDLGWSRKEYDSVRRSLRYKGRTVQFA